MLRYEERVKFHRPERLNALRKQVEIMKPMSWIPNLNYLIDNSSFISCHLLPVNEFVPFCKSLGIDISEERLEHFEKIGVFYPIARVQYPDKVQGFIDIWSQKEYAIKWLEEGTIWEPSSRSFQNWDTFRESGAFFDKIISFYSKFQCYPLYHLIQHFKENINTELFIEFDEEKLKQLLNRAVSWSQMKVAAYQRKNIEPEDWLLRLMFHEWKHKAIWRNIAATICQIISNRYYPETKSDNRTMQISGDFFHYPEWNWHEYSRSWNAKSVLEEIGLEKEELKTLHDIVAHEAKNLDPLENWYELISFISVNMKEKLKGNLLFMQELWGMEKMIRLFYEEVANTKLAIHEVPPFIDVEKQYGKGIYNDELRYLELVTNRYHLNPKPNLILVLEGDGEESQIPRIAEELFGVTFPRLGIEIMNIEGTGDFEGEKLIKLIDYYHYHQTIIFIILDKENNVEAKKRKYSETLSKLYPGRKITKDEYIYLWDRCIEFDNFTYKELALALSLLCDKKYEFTDSEIAEAEHNFLKKSNPLGNLYKEKLAYSLSKPKLLEILVNMIIRNKLNEFDIEGKPKRKIVQVIHRILELAEMNYQPVTNDIWRRNQESGYFGSFEDKKN